MNRTIRSLENPSHDATSDSTSDKIMNRPRPVRRRKISGDAVFDRKPHDPCTAIRILQARPASHITTESLGASSTARDSLLNQSVSESETAYGPKIAKAFTVPKSQVASQVTIACYNSSRPSQVNTLLSSPTSNMTGTALDQTTGSSSHSMTSTKRSRIPSRAVTMQYLKNTPHRSQVAIDKQSQSGASLHSGTSAQSWKSKASAWFEHARQFKWKANKPPRTVKKTAAMVEFIKSGGVMHEGT